MKIAEVFESINNKMKEDLEKLSKLIPHSGEEGGAKEDAIREFLETYLPERFGVATGFVFDFKGDTSQQIDVVIFDRMVAPRFKILGNRYFFPCESVVAVGELKTNLTKEKLVDSIGKIRSVKSLDRTAGGKNVVRNGYQFEMPNEKLDPSKNHVDNIFGFIFSIDSGSLNSVAQNTITEIIPFPRQQWPNLVCIMNRGLISYFSIKLGGLTTDPYVADGLYFSEPEDSNTSFLKWFSLLGNDICRVHLAGIPFLDYFDVKNTPNQKIAFNKTDTK